MAFTPIKTYKIVTTGTHSRIAIDNSLLAAKASPNTWTAKIVAKTTDAAVKFGDSTVEAVVTLTSGALGDGNIHYLAGQPPQIVNLPVDATHVSAQGFAAGPGEIWITLGFGE